MKYLRFATLTIFLLTSGLALADPFECGGQLIETGVGTTKEQVMALCGPPTSRDEDRWYYVNQPGQVTVIIQFVNGEVQNIRHVLHQ